MWTVSIFCSRNISFFAKVGTVVNLNIKNYVSLLGTVVNLNIKNYVFSLLSEWYILQYAWILNSSWVLKNISTEYHTMIMAALKLSLEIQTFYFVLHFFGNDNSLSFISASQLTCHTSFGLSFIFNILFILKVGAVTIPVDLKLCCCLGLYQLEHII